jgi:hypothetical protein
MSASIARIALIAIWWVVSIAAMPAYAESDTSLWRPAVSGGRAMSGNWAGFRLWGEAAGFSVGRRSAGYGVQGGAALPLAGRVGLTAGYRLMGFSLGDRLDAEFDDVALRSLAPILGIDVEF